MSIANPMLCGATALAEYAGASVIGRYRARNEDALGVIEAAEVFVVADGCGGVAPGDLASNVAVETFRRCFGEGALRLEDAVRAANLAVIEAVRGRWERAGLGSTLAALRLGAEWDAVVHVGDCRVSRLRDGKLERLTLDHDLMQLALRQGVALEVIAGILETHSTVLTASLGFDADIPIDVRHVMGRPGDIYVLCSDGVTRQLGDAEIAEIVGGGDGLAERLHRLLAAAEEGGGGDDATAILVRRR